MHPWIWLLRSRYAIYGASCCVYAIYGGPGLGSFPAAWGSEDGEAAARSEQIADVVRVLKRIDEAEQAGKGARRGGRCAT